MTLRDMMARHAQKFVSANLLGEAATYRFHQGDDDRELRVVVNREQLSTLDGDPGDNVTIQRATVFIPRHATAGVLTIDEGDQLLIPVRYGEPAVWCRIVEEVSSDAHGFVVVVVA